VVASFKLSPWPQANDLVTGLTPAAVLARLRDLSRFRDVLAAFAQAPMRFFDWGIGPLAVLGALVWKRLSARSLGTQS
jgi:hypothetical protein